MPTRAMLESVDVMIVDDNAHMRTLLRSVLRAAGLRRMREASEVQDALDQLSVAPCDLVLLDYAMPGLSGLDFLRILRADPDHPAHKARVIMVTGYGDRTHVAAARDAGADEFLVKPITTRALLQRIEAVLSRGRQFVESDEFQGPDRRRRASSPPPGAERRDKAAL